MNVFDIPKVKPYMWVSIIFTILSVFLTLSAKSLYKETGNILDPALTITVALIFLFANIVLKLIILKNTGKGRNLLISSLVVTFALTIYSFFAYGEIYALGYFLFFITVLIMFTLSKRK